MLLQDPACLEAGAAGCPLLPAIADNMQRMAAAIVADGKGGAAAL